MNKNWPTKEKDIYVAQCIIEEYVNECNGESLGLFELVINQEEKRIDFRLSSWVIAISEYFKSIYGIEKGDFITRQVISHCIVKGETIH